MKTLRNIMMASLVVIFATGCENDGYMDPITPVAPGSDETAPVVEITNPTGDVIIPFTDDETTVNFRFEAVDDIELKSITVTLNGNQVATYDDFKDYRRSVQTYSHEDLPVGNHTLAITAVDLSGKSTTQTLDFEVSNKYVAKYQGEVFYMPFEGQLYMDILNEESATVVGDPGFTTSAKVGDYAYSGAEGSYLTYPTSNLNLGEEFSAVMWINVQDNAANRAGVLVIGPPDEANPDAANNRTKGFRFFHEGGATNQIFKLNVGNGTADAWIDGGSAAAVNPATTEWVHYAFTISPTVARVYKDGTMVKETTITGVSWDNTSILSIMSGAPYFAGWNHLSDPSYLDELRLFNKALTQVEIQAIIDDEL